METKIRDETARDQRSIYSVTESAFRGMPFADGNEQDVVNRLRSAGALSVSLVATNGQAIVGHIAFSPAEAADSSVPWFALGPVSVLPAYQHQGVGSSLILRGLKRIQHVGARGCILTGDPAYYSRFGFQHAPLNAPSREPAEFFMLKLFSGREPSGTFAFHPAFYEDSEHSVRR